MASPMITSVRSNHLRRPIGLTSKDHSIGRQGFNIWAGENIHSIYCLVQTERQDSLIECGAPGSFLYHYYNFWSPYSMSCYLARLCLPSFRPLRLHLSCPIVPAKPLPFFPQDMAHYNNISKDLLYYLFICQYLENRVFKMTKWWTNEWL